MYPDEIKIGQAENLQGKIFGYLKVLYRIKNIGKHTAWKCECLRDGNLVDVRADHLKEGRVISCGCYNKEKSAKHLRNINHKGKNMKDISGYISGFLIAIEPTDKRIQYGEKDSRVIWKCKCYNPEHIQPVECEATSTAITQQQKLSCGCIKSKGELTIINFFQKNHIYYEREKTFETCKNENNQYYRFDFYVENKYLIEFDGKQHYQATNNGWNTKENLKQIQKNDKIKNKWSFENNIPLIRIPFYHLENLTLEDLKLETSKFIVKNYE